MNMSVLFESHFSKKLAYWVSAIFHPIISSTLIYYIVLFHSNFQFEGLNKPNFLFLIFISTFFLLGILLVMLKKLGIIPSIGMHKREERRIPLILTLILLIILCFIIFNFYKAYSILFIVMLMITFSIFLILVITEFWKISVHAAGFGGLVGCVYFLYFYQNTVTLLFLLLINILTVLLLWSRLVLNAHNYLQLIAGFLLSFSLSFFSCLIFI